MRDERKEPWFPNCADPVRVANTQEFRDAVEAVLEKNRQGCGEHRPPQGPNEDIDQCHKCGWMTYSMRPPGETFGHHLDDCSLPIRHESYCEPGGKGHPKSDHVRGFWPGDERGGYTKGEQP